MKKILLASFAVLSIAAFTAFSINTNAIAGDDEVKVDHYEGKEFKNADDAMKTLLETTLKMSDIAADKDLDVAKMEQIHETSYTTEDAIALLGKDAKGDTKVLAEKLELVHLASEEHEADKLRRYFIAYQAELNNYITAK